MLAPNVVSLPSLISWLRTKEPSEAYIFPSYYNCAFTQYLAHCGYDVRTPDGWKLFEQLHERYLPVVHVGEAASWTFGQALERALQMEDGHVHQ